MTNADYADDHVLLANTPAQTDSLLHRLKQEARHIDISVNSDKEEFTCFKQDEAISTLNGKEFVEQFTYIGSNITSTESNVNICIEKAWTAMDRLLIIWKSKISVKIKWEFF